MSGKIPDVDQFVIGGFEIKEKISVFEAYERFPEQRLKLGEDGQVSGNASLTPQETTDDQKDPEIDDTFAEVVIDGIRLDPSMIRALMAQNVLPSLSCRVSSMNCPNCCNSQFDQGEAAYVPSPIHTCTDCKTQFPTRGRTRNVVANSLPAILETLAKHAFRSPQDHRLNLMPETL